MDEEELRRKMDFIVDQQAQFVTDILELRLAQNELILRQTKLTDAMIAVVGMVGTISKSQEELVSKVEALADAQKATEERVNVLIDVVEKYFSERRNGSDHGDSVS